ncbi:tetratricopeptide repeat-containing sulfotransferase family protein [Neptunicoccus sediminis]|uniref:tetratricopeptide repeat-containing sulfotransferase family protein n=1 Tax=Neptunicoccus sediminis TaxID=1892596 RepID=UPI000845C9C7|nr:tetratricopeptide repeat-containing sulfotransferase family protein [Neptunicoccus sediminis]
MAGAGATIKQVLDAAEQAAKAGDVARAVALYRQILTKAPKHSKAKKALARLEKQGGAANRAMTQADANALVQVLNGGDFARARQVAEEMARAFPNEPFIYNILGYTCGMLGDQKAAIEAYKWAIKLNPNFVEAMSNYGSYLVQIDRAADAVPVLQKAVTKKPDYAEAHHNLGVAYAAVDQLDKAMQHYDLALRHAPRYANALNSRGSLKSTLNDRIGAEADFRAALQIAPNDTGAMVNLGGVLSADGKSSEATEILEKAAALDPRNIETFVQLGIILNESGRNEAALSSFRKVLEINPNHAKTLRLMLGLVPAEERAGVVEHIQRLFEDPATPDLDKVQLGFALGEHYEKQAAYEQSFVCLDQANRLYRAALPPMPQSDDEKFDRITGLFDSDAFAKLKDASDPSDAPVFVLGMMRSGTSLVEQIIATHSAVYGAGELNTATDLARPLYDKGSRATLADARTFTEGYLRDLLRNAGDVRHVVDKMPGNFFNVGLIRTLFPNAKIVNTVRDPRDNCFSIYKNFFDTYAHQYAYDQGELARFANRYKAMMNRWDELFPDAVYHIRYESLVTDQEAESRKLLAYLGLPWEDSVLEFHKTERAVRTASVNQVRQKIYRSSVKSWQNYEPYLQELIDGLDRELWGDAFVD